MAHIVDKIRKIHDADQTVRSGPGHAGLYIDSNENLMVNINEEDGPQQVGADLAGDTLSVLKRVATAFTSHFEDDGPAITIDNENLAIWIGAYRDIDTGTITATRTTCMKIELVDDADGIVSIGTFIDQVAGEEVDTDKPGLGFSFDSSNVYFGENKVEHGTPTQFVVAGAAAGDITVTGIGVNDLLTSVIMFTAGVPSNLTSQFSITGDNKVNNTGGTNTTGKTLVISVLARA